MNLNIVSWNVRGLNCGKKRCMIRNMLRIWKADVMCFQETKLEGEIANIVKEIWGSRWADYVQLEASGTRGSILIMWDKRIWEDEVSSVGPYSDSCCFSGKNQEILNGT
uniref:Putative ovule protein n=1 Tax=Solanum chacoense TaxID=4108 RepID=A0A0V0GSF1_SOLCH